MARSLQEIRDDRAGRETLAHVVSVLSANLELAALLGAYEYEAGEDGLPEFAEAFRQVAKANRTSIQVMMELLMDGGAHLPPIGQPLRPPPPRHPPWARPPPPGGPPPPRCLGEPRSPPPWGTPPLQLE